jgi:hypothetical protein
LLDGGSDDDIASDPIPLRGNEDSSPMHSKGAKRSHQARSVLGGRCSGQAVLMPGEYGHPAGGRPALYSATLGLWAEVLVLCARPKDCDR